MKGHIPQWLSMNSLVAWIIPLAACFVFISLFASANPLIEYRLQQIDLRAIFDNLAPTRMRILDGAGLRDMAFAAAARAADAALAVRTPHRRRSFRSGASVRPAGRHALTDPVQRAVRAGERARSDLSLGRRYPARWHDLRVLRTPWRLSPDRDRAARRRLCPDRDASGRARRAIQADPAPGAAMGRTKRPARGLLNLPARSLCRGLLADLSAARGLHLDGAGRQPDWC